MYLNPNRTDLTKSISRKIPLFAKLIQIHLLHFSTTLTTQQAASNTYPL